MGAGVTIANKTPRRLVPGHDTNRDGFLNAEDVIRDDLAFALFSEGRWKPIKVMVEVGEKGRQKRILEWKRDIERKKEMALALAEHDRLMKAHSPPAAVASNLPFKQESPREAYERIGRNSVGNAEDMFGKNGTPHGHQHVNFEQGNDIVIDQSGHAGFRSVERRDEAYVREGDAYHVGGECGVEKQESLVDRHKRKMSEEKRILQQLAGDHELDDTDMRLLHAVAGGRDSLAMVLDGDLRK